MNSPAPIYSRTADIIEAEVGGEIVLLHTGNWQYYEFDKVGAAIWRLLETPMCLDDLVNGLTAKFDVSPELCEQETNAFLTEVVSNGLVVVQNG